MAPLPIPGGSSRAASSGRFGSAPHRQSSRTSSSSRGSSVLLAMGLNHNGGGGGGGPTTVVALLMAAALVLSGFSSAFRPSSSSNNPRIRTTAAMGRDSDGSRPPAANAVGGNDGGGGAVLLRDGLNRASSFGVKLIRNAGTVVERHKRTYWDDLAPPFGVPSVVRKEEEKLGRRRKLTGTTGGAAGGDAVRTMTERARARSIATGTLEEEAAACLRTPSSKDTDDTDDESCSSAGSLDSFFLDSSDDEDEQVDVDAGVTTKMPIAPSASETTGTIDVTHLCFLVHGHRGYSRDLDYVRTAIRGAASDERRSRRRRQLRSRGRSTSTSTSRSNHGDPDGAETAAKAAVPDRDAPAPSSVGHSVVVHSAVCNEGRTNDGVRAGGERLVREMLDVIRAEADRKRKRKRRRRQSGDGSKIDRGERQGDGDDTEANDDEVVEFTLSMVGNSLGGVYSRYAVARLFHMSQGSTTDVDGAILLDGGKIRLHPRTFCTTATPHLGCSQHTWVSLPRPAERAVGHALGQTGRDLFRMNDLLRTMGTDPYFLDPLAAFDKRVAYANGYHTDFPVPAATAAFLHEDSAYPHHLWEEEEEEMEGKKSGSSELDKYIVAVLRTMPSSSDSTTPSVPPKYLHRDDELRAMSTALDSLGWKKVIVDLRHEISVGLSVPPLIRKHSSLVGRRRSSASAASPSQGRGGGGRTGASMIGTKEEEQEGGGGARVEEIEYLPEEHARDGTLADSRAHAEDDLRRSRSVIASHEAKAAFASPRDGSIHLPVGHNMICAFSRGRVSSHMNRGGRPVMDKLAREVVRDMFAWEPPSSRIE